MAEKKDTSLKHAHEDVNLDDLLFKNLAQIYGTTPLQTNDVEYLNNCIDNWLNDNAPDVMSMKLNAEREAIEPLFSILYSKVDHKLEDADPNLIRAALKFIVGRRLSNLRRNTENGKARKRDPPSTHAFLTPERSKTRELSAAPTTKPVPVAANVEDFGIRARAIQDASTGQSSQHPQLSVATLKDVIPEPIVDNKSLIGQASFKLWGDILGQDIGYTESHTITYMFAEGLLTIARDRQFRAALLEAQAQGLAYVIFDITPPSSAQHPLANPISPQVSQVLSPEKQIVTSAKGSSSDNAGKRRISTPGGRDAAKKQAFGKRRPDDDSMVEVLDCLSPKQTRQNENLLSEETDAVAGPSPSNNPTNPEDTRDLPLPEATTADPGIIVHPGVVEDLSGVKDTEEEPETTAEQLMAKVKLTATEHLHERGRWERCCSLFLHDPLKTTPKERIRIPGLKTPLFLYQAFGVFVMFEMEMYQGGGYNADDMGLGKTIELLGLICLNRILEVAYTEVVRARRAQSFHMHLAKGTSAAPQSEDAECPSGYKFGILCPCVNSGPAAQLKPTSGPNLIVVPAALVPNWLQEIRTHLESNDTHSRWEVRQAYDPKLSQLAAELTKSDRLLIEREPELAERPTNLVHRPDQSRVIVVTTKGRYNGHVRELMKDIHYPPRPPRAKKTPLAEHRHWKVAWGRVVADEAHIEVTSTSGTVTLFRNFGPKVRKWFLTGTPFERSPASMAGWINTIETPEWTKPLPSPSWPEKAAHCAKLKLCTSASLREMGKKHERIVAGREDQQIVINQYVKLLTEVLGTLWLKRSTMQSTFFGYPLTQIIPNEHIDIDCILPDKYKQIVNSELTAITEHLKTEHAANVKKWVRSGRLGREPQISAASWMRAVRRLRVLSSFPQLGELTATKTLAFTGEEDYRKGWIHVTKGHLYELETGDSPYERYVTDICAEHNCPKAKAILLLIKDWKQDEKAVFCSMGPTNALVLYWYLRLVIKAPVALITAHMSKSTVMDVVSLFQEDAVAMKNFPTITSPQYLVGTTRLIGVGYTLHKARRLVQLDPEWMERDQEQAKKRINRIGQKEATFTYMLRCVGSAVEETIYDRQNRRTHLVRMALDREDFSQDELKPGVDSDEEDDKVSMEEGGDEAEVV